jgi:5-formyltetrahydrofolate cyclo-ligase
MVAADSLPQLPSKTALRRQILQRRQALPAVTWQTKSQQLCEQIQRSLWFQRSQTILAYFSTRQEPDLSPLFTLPKVWGFPRCVGKDLVWHEWAVTDHLPLQQGAFGILEPHPDALQLTASQVDLILVPAVACDQQGYRLGYGGGFYDRLLTSPEWVNLPTIGILFDFARFPQLPHDDWDHPLQSICTESGWFPVSTN